MLRNIYLVSIAFLLCFSGCVKDRSSAKDPVQAIPINAALIAETHDIRTTLENVGTSRLWGAVDSTELLDDFRAEMDLMRTYLLNDSVAIDFTGRSVFLSLHRSGADRFSALFLTESAGFPLKALHTKLHGKADITKQSYDGVEVYQVELRENNLSFAYAQYRGTVLLSADGDLVKDAIRQINSDLPITLDKGFDKLYQAANKKDDANIFVNYKYIPDVFKKLFPKARTGWLGEVAGWTALDLATDEKEWLLSGLTYASDSLPGRVQLFKDNAPQKITAAEILPGHTAVMLAYGVENVLQYYRNYKNYLSHSNRMPSFKRKLENYPFDTEQACFSWIDNEFGIFITEHSGGQLKENSFAFFKARRSDDALDRLKPATDTTFSERYRTYTISRLAQEDLLPAVFGETFRGFKKPYFTAVDRYLIFANEAAALQGVINDLIAGKTLAKDKHFKNFMKKVSPRSSVLAYAHNPAALSVLRTFMNKKAAARVEAGSAYLSKFKGAALQLNAEKGLYYTNLYFQYNPHKKTGVKQLWVTALDTTLAGTPQQVVNHYNKEREILIQDQEHALYLVDPAGEVIWKKDLKAAIMGSVQQVDLYKNGKLQYAFNTATAFHIIDRKGNEVEGFPLLLEDTATAPLAVFDYDRTRKYRFVIPCGAKVYNFDRDGGATKGWEFHQATSPIRKAARHFAVNGKDYIVFAESNGTVRILDRRGRERVKVSQQFNWSENDLYFIKGSSEKTSRLVTTNRAGQLISIFLNGKHDITSIGSLNPDHHFVYFNDHTIILDQNKLSVTSTGRSFQYAFQQQVSGAPVAFSSGDELLIGVVSKTANEVYLIDGKGKLLNGFPVFGNTAFTLTDPDANGDRSLIVGSREGSLYNYTVN